MSHATTSDEQFMATVSHELRGPLHAILGLSEVLVESGLDVGEKRIAEALHREANSMAVLVDDVVAYGQFSSATPSLTNAPFAPRTLVTSVVDRLRPAAEEAGLRLLVEFDSEVPLRVVGDEVRFGQVVHNLVSNAIRYTELGSVQVMLAGDGSMLALQVRDTGHGIAAPDLDRIFEPFARVGDSGVRGTGLGLAVVKRISEVMQGTISVDSTVGVGTTFVFTIPAAPVADAETDRVPRGDAVDGRVLIVEDSEINRTLALKQLELLGLAANAVESGEDALDYLETNTVDLILMDWNLPGISGLETASAIRDRHLVDSAVPIVAMTANVLTGDRDKCLAAGMNDHLGKPVSLDNMRTMLDQWLATEDAANSERASEVSHDSVHEAIDQLVDDLGDVETVRIVVETYLSELAVRAEALLNPAPESAESARRAAHTLRSTSALLGAEGLANLCLEFEQRDELDEVLREEIRNEISSVEVIFAQLLQIGIAS